MTNDSRSSTFEATARWVGYILEGMDWKLPIERELERLLGYPFQTEYCKAWKALVRNCGLRKALMMAGIPPEKLEEMDWYAFDVYRLWFWLGHHPSDSELRYEYGEEWYQSMIDLLGSTNHAVELDSGNHDGLDAKEFVVSVIRRSDEVPREEELDRTVPWRSFFKSYKECLAQCLGI